MRATAQWLRVGHEPEGVTRVVPTLWGRIQTRIVLLALSARS